MRTRRTVKTTTTVLVSLSVVFLSLGAQAAEPLSDRDLGDVHIVSGDVLNIAGVPAAGNTSISSTTTGDDPAINEPPKQVIERIFRDESLPSLNNRKEVSSQGGSTQIVYRERDRQTSVHSFGVADSAGIRLTQGNRIESISVINAGGAQANRGDFSLEGLSISNQVQISPSFR